MPYYSSDSDSDEPPPLMVQWRMDFDSSSSDSDIDNDAHGGAFGVPRQNNAEPMDSESDNGSLPPLIRRVPSSSDSDDDPPPLMNRRHVGRNSDSSDDSDSDNDDSSHVYLLPGAQSFSDSEDDEPPPLMRRGPDDSDSSDSDGSDEGNFPLPLYRRHFPLGYDDNDDGDRLMALIRGITPNENYDVYMRQIVRGEYGWLTVRTEIWSSIPTLFFIFTVPYKFANDVISVVYWNLYIKKLDKSFRESPLHKMKKSREYYNNVK